VDVIDGIWILTHRRVGDLQQMRRLASLLAMPVVEKRLRFRNDVLAAIPELATRLLDRARSDPLEPPWPKVVFCAEARASSIARHIKRRSAGCVRIVCIGRPSGSVRDFDLVISTVQFRLPQAQNVLHVQCPLLPPEAVTAGEVSGVTQRAAGLPRPHIALLVGGTSSPDSLDEAAAADLGRSVSKEARRLGGSVLVSTSPRTGRRAEQALASAMEAGAEIYLWSQKNGPNPYRSLLAAADRLVVTSDSVSMVMEALATGKPVSLYRLPQRLGIWHSAIERLHAAGFHAPFDRGWLETRPDRGRLFDGLIAQGSLAIFPDLPARSLDPQIFVEAEQLALARLTSLF
jgi:mitochondrial fission protein ELM1